MTAIIAHTLGVDISKATLDGFLHPEAAARQFANTRAGIAPIARDSGQHSGKRFIRAGRAHPAKPSTRPPWSQSASTPT